MEGKKQNLKMKDLIQTDTSTERSFLDSLSFDASARINSLEDPELRADVISAVMEIPIIYNMLCNDRLYAKDLQKDSEGKIEVDISSPHILHLGTLPA